MKPEKLNNKDSMPENTLPETRSKIRWGLVFAGLLLLVFGLILPLLANRYYSRLGNKSGEPKKVKIPESPAKEQSKSGYKKKGQTAKKKKSLPKADSGSSIKAINRTTFEKENLQNPVYAYVENLDVLAFQFAENKNERNSKSAKPDPTAAPNPNEISDGKKKRNVLEKIYDWFVGLFKKKKKPVENLPANVTSLSLSEKEVFLPCPPGTGTNGSSCSDNMSVSVKTLAVDPENDTLKYTYRVSGGRIIGQGANIIWDLSGVGFGTYTITAGVSDDQGVSGKTITETVSVKECSCQSQCSCPTLSVTGPTIPIQPGDLMSFTANISGGNQRAVNYNWSVSQGTIVSGQGTSFITVDTFGLSNKSITATVSISDGNCSECFISASETGVVAGSNVPPGFLMNFSGKIVDSSGKAIRGARITLRNTETGFNYPPVTSDNEGQYIFDSIQPGTYIYSVTAQGYIGKSTIITVSLGGENTITFELESSTNNSNSITNNTGNADGNINSNVNNNSNIAVNDNTNTPVNDNTPGNSNTATKIKDATDTINYDYPKYILEDTDHFINLELNYVKGTPTPGKTEVTVNTNTTIIVVEVPDLPQDRKNYDTCVNAELIAGEELETELISGSDLEAENICESDWRKYKRELNSDNYPNWRWKVKLKNGFKDRKETKFELKLNFGYKLQNSPNSEIEFKQTPWKTNPPLLAYIGLPFWVWFFYYLSISGGAVLSAIGVINKKKIEEIPELLVLGDPNALPVEDEVQCTLYAPAEAKAGNDFLVQVFAHLEEQAEGLAEIAGMTDESIKKQAVKNLDKIIERGSVLTFQLSMSGVEIDDPIQNYKWNGKVIEIPFIVSVPKEQEPIIKFGKVIVSENNVPVGRLTFKINIVGNIQTLKAEEKSLSQEGFKRYQQAFISYASENRPDVLERVQMLEAARIEYFQDVLSLDPGERWEKSLYKYIDRSDVVFLFWSKAASESQWVEKEVLYALERQQGQDNAPPDIIPIIIEGPPPVKPPASLSFLHFNDKFIYFIYAAEAEHKIKKWQK